MLDERKAGILGAVVEAYIETAQPVGSSLVARSGSVDVLSLIHISEPTRPY